MLKKLLKYDFKDMYKFLQVFYILSVLFALLTRILLSVKQIIIIQIISQISMGFMFSMLASSLINTLMRSWVRFKDTIYKDESYLTHTLPVTKCQIYESKFILSITCLITTFLVIILSLEIAFGPNLKVILDEIKNISNMFNMSYIPFIIVIGIILFLEIYNALQSGFLGIILGHSKDDNKILYSVVFGFIVYIISQLIVLLILFIISISNKAMMNIFTDNAINNLNILKYIIIIFIVVYSLIILFTNLICVYLLKRGVNVE